MEFKIELGNQIRKHRLDKGFTQEKLAELSGFDRTYISLLERGKRDISFNNVVRVIKTLDIPFVEFAQFIDENNFKLKG